MTHELGIRITAPNEGMPTSGLRSLACVWDELLLKGALTGISEMYHFYENMCVYVTSFFIYKGQSLIILIIRCDYG